MSRVLVDSNVLLDVLTRDPTWIEWSAGALALIAEAHTLVINPIIYSEVSVGFHRIEEVDAQLPANVFRREPLPWSAGFLAGKAFMRYRRKGGARRSPLPDFYIGAHASVGGMTVLTRDPTPFRHYYPRVPLITP
jgi:predicted nucleic acid-binding protein